MAAIICGFLVLAPTGRRIGIFEEARPGTVVNPGERAVMQVAEVDLEGRRCFVGQVPSATVAAEDVEDAARSLASNDHVVVVTPWVEHPMWKNASMPARLVYRGASATPVEDAACAVALVLAGWGWDEREIIPVDVDGYPLRVRITPGNPYRCVVEAH